MERVSVEDVEPSTKAGEIDCRQLSDPLGTTDVAINHYRLEPGDALPGGLHAHVDQEEVFLVLEGKATFETMAGDVAVGADEAIRFGPGEFQSGRNDGDEDLVVVALGAPRDSEDVRLPLECPACGNDTLHIDSGEEGIRFVCPDCATEQFPKECPECGHDDLRVTLDDEDRTVVGCQDCRAAFEEPPLRDHRD